MSEVRGWGGCRPREPAALALYKRFSRKENLMPGESDSPVQMKGQGPRRAAAPARGRARRHPGGGRADYEKVVSGMSEVRGWGAFAGAPRSGAALCAVQAFSRRENLDAGRIQFARADEGAGPGWAPAGGAGTQAEDALTMKVASGMSEVRGWAFAQAPRERGGALRRTSVFPKGNLMPGEFSSPVQMKGPGPPAGLGPLGQAQAPRRRTR